MKHVKFLPWIGSRYYEGILNKRVMVLGESHYCASEKDAVPQITNTIIKDLFDESSKHEYYKNTYTKFAKALSGNFGQLSCKDKENLWNSVLFYNYVQTPISGPRRSPTSQEFAESEHAFFEVLETYKPDYIIAWGKRLYNNLPQVGYIGTDIITSDDKYIETWVYKLESGKDVRILPILHPSAGFSPKYWNYVIHKFI